MKKNIFLGFVILISTASFAQDYSEPVSEGEIIVEKPTDLTQNYRDRRNRFGMLFSVNYEKFSPNNYTSLIQNKTFAVMSGGDTIPILGAELGVKFNFLMGSLAGLVGYGAGNYVNVLNSVDKISAKMTKITLNFALDNLTSEPWIVPYVQAGANQINWLESSRDILNVSKEEAFITSWNLNYKLGLLFQLDFIESAIDSNTHTNGLRTSGLQNTFLDIFYTSYAQPNVVAAANGATGEANLQSDNFGVGLKLEF